MKPPPFVRGMFRFVTYMTTINGYKDHTNMCVFSFLYLVYLKSAFVSRDPGTETISGATFR